MEQLGQFKLVARIGRGGSGSIYKATDTTLNRTVALKVFHFTQLDDDRVVRRFKAEARAAAQLNHVNLVTVFSIGEDQDRFYIAMEYVDGENLAQLIKREGSIDPARAAGIVLAASTGLREAHTAGFIHRDIKPHNIMVDRRGIVKVTDFGLARPFLDHESGSDSGAFPAGTPRYMSPEQCRNNRLDPRTDIFSLGSVFFELLAGRPAYEGKTLVSVVHSVLHQPCPDVRAISPRVPVELAAIVNRMVEKDAAKRYQDISSLAAALGAWYTAESTKAKGPKPEVVVPTPFPQELRHKNETEFIIHCVEQDAPWAEWMTQVLGEADYRTRRVVGLLDDEGSVLSGIDADSRKGAWVIPCLSPDYIDAIAGSGAWSSRFVLGHWNLLPVVLRNCVPPPSLSMTNYVSLVRLDTESCKRRVLEAADRALRSWGSGRLHSLTPIEWSLTPRSMRHAVWNLPFVQDPSHVKRADLLNEVYDALTLGNGIVALRRHPASIRGVGLSTLALDYAFANRANYALIWWIRAPHRASVLTDMATMAGAADIPGKWSKDYNYLVEGVKGWLSSNDNWLLIFDDVRSWDRIRNLLPERIRGHVLLVASEISSINADGEESIKRVVVSGFRRRESLEYLMRRTQSMEETSAADLATALGDYPLALDIASCCINTLDCSLPEFKRLYDSRLAMMVRAAPTLDAGGTCMSALCSLAIEELGKQSKADLLVAVILSYLDSPACLRDELEHLVNCFPKSVGKSWAKEAMSPGCLDRLRHAGLVTWDKDVIHMPAPIRKTIRFWVEKEDSGTKNPMPFLSRRLLGVKDPNAWLEASSKFLSELFMDPQSSEERKTFHIVGALTVLSRMRDRGLESQDIAELWARISWFCEDHNLNVLAAAALERAVAIVERINNSEGARLHEWCVRRAMIGKNLGDHAEAERWLNRAEDYAVRIYGKWHLEYARLLAARGDVSVLAGDPDSARSHYQSALEVLNRHIARNAVEAGQVLLRMGDMEAAQGNHGLAQELYDEAQALIISVLGEYDAEVGKVHKRKGALYLSLGVADGAREHFQSALECDRRAYGEQHAEVAQDYSSLGRAAESLAVYVRACDYYAKGISIGVALPDGDYYQLAKDHLRMANCLNLLQKPDEARLNLLSAQKIYTRYYGPDNIRVQQISALLSGLDTSGVASI